MQPSPTANNRGRLRAGRLALALLLVGAAATGVSPLRAAAEQNEQPGSPAAASIALGTRHTCVIVSGAVRCWGRNIEGQLGLGNTNTIGEDEHPATNVNLGGTTATAIAAGADFTCALLTGGAVRCWGRNDFGQLGLGNTTTIGDNESPTTNVNLGGAIATAIATGSNHTCAILTGGAVRCWGENLVGGLGLANTNTIGDDESPTTNVNLGGATAIAITTGQSGTCALLTGGAVRCWGYNIYGQLGLGHTNNIGDDENPTVNVNLGGATAVAISSGSIYTCALLTGGAVRCWGYNADGELGIGNTLQIGDNENPTTNVNLGGATAIAISAGSGPTCVVLTGGAVRCWGYNADGELGLGNTNNIGDNEDPTTNVNLATTALTVSAGGHHACAVLSSGALRCWGENNWGQLGLANTTYIGDDENPTTNVLNVSVGPDSTNPTVGITAPTPNQVFAGPPITITGTAADAGGIASVGVAIYRYVAGGQYWNGTTWQAGNTTVATTLTNPNSTATNWSYTFGAPPGGVFAVAAVAIDPANNAGIANYQAFSIPDPTTPTVTLTTPTPNQAFVGAPVNITGTATDNAGISDVLVSVYRPVGPNGQFWNGSAWQTTYTTVAATMAAPGAASTAWTYSFTPPQPGGLFYVAAISVDTSYNYQLTAFTPFTMPDATPPTAVVLTPVANATTSGTISITGTAADNSAIALVGVAIYRAGTGEYFNGSTWQAGFATIPATMSSPGSATTTWSTAFTPPTPGFYLIAALAVDGNYGYTLTSFTTITAT